MAVINFVMNYYIWFLIGIILILLAIIGAYADKTNFGQGKKEDSKKPENVEENLKDKKLAEAVGQDYTSNTKNVLEEKDLQPVNLENNNISTEQVQNNQTNTTNEEELMENNQEKVNEEKKESDARASSNLENDSVEITSKSLNIEDKLNKLNNEINNILPEKELIDSSLLEDVSDMTLDSKENNLFDKGNAFDLDDLKLPEIKKPKKEIEDVWKK